MNREISIFLDLARFLAAYLVFLSHAAWTAHTGGLFWQIRGLGREAVDVFFVLSGFVIAHATASRAGTARDYAVNRSARIASVALPALALTFVADTIGVAFNPDLYTGFCCEPGMGWWAYGRNLLFLGEVWSQHIPPGSNGPYWSLCYEVWYYVAFGLYRFLPRRQGVPAVALLLLLVGPGIAVLFPLWLLGVAIHGRTLAPRRGWWLLGFGAAAIIAALISSDRQGQIYDPFAFTVARMMDYGRDYAMGLAFAMFLMGFIAVAPRFAAPLRAIERPIRWLAGGTFALYLFHLPLLRLLAAVMPVPVLSWQMWLAVYLGVPLATFALAEVTERRKLWWRTGIERLFARVA